MLPLKLPRLLKTSFKLPLLLTHKLELNHELNSLKHTPLRSSRPLPQLLLQCCYSRAKRMVIIT